MKAATLLLIMGSVAPFSKYNPPGGYKLQWEKK